MVAQWAGLRCNLWASERKGRLHLERLGDIGRECLTETVDLLLHLRYGERWAAHFQDTHVSHEEVSSITMDVRVRAGDGDLLCQHSTTNEDVSDLPSEAWCMSARHRCES